MSRKNLSGLFAVVVICLFATVCAVDTAEATEERVLTRAQSEELEEIISCPDHPTSEWSYRSIFLQEDFENAGFPPVGWDTTNYNPGFGWFLGTAALGGTQCALVTWDDIAPVTLQDEWLFTPGMDVSAAVDSLLRLDFWFFKDNLFYQHDFKIYISTIGDTIHGNYTEIWDSYDVAYTHMQWYEASVDLGAYAGQDSIFLAFQFLGTDANLFGIDDIVVTDDPPPTGRCCYGDPFNPSCEDEFFSSYCSDLNGYWVEGLNCIDNPCPFLSYHIEPSDDMYTDPDDGMGHAHPIAPDQLWTADYTAGCGNHHQRIMMKFDLSPYLGKEIDSAFLNVCRFFRCPNTFHTTCNFYHITEHWSEDTWDERTHIGHEALSWKTYNFGPDNDWYRVDVKAGVEDWLNETVTNYGFVIQAQSGQKWSKFHSKEAWGAAAGLHPYLEVYITEEHLEVEGLRLVMDNDTLVWVDGETVVGDLEVRWNKSLDSIEVYLVDNEGNLFQPDPTTYSLITEVADTDTATTIIVDDWQFTLTGNGVGDTELTIEVRQNGHSEYTSPHILVQVYKCGDADSNRIINISDAVFLIGFIFGGTAEPDPYEAGDCDCNIIINISDAVYLIGFIFGSGLEPCAECP